VVVEEGRVRVRLAEGRESQYECLTSNHARERERVEKEKGGAQLTSLSFGLVLPPRILERFLRLLHIHLILSISIH
jgi:hypothetical protein